MTDEMQAFEDVTMDRFFEVTEGSSELRELVRTLAAAHAAQESRLTPEVSSSGAVSGTRVTLSGDTADLVRRRVLVHAHGHALAVIQGFSAPANAPQPLGPVVLVGGRDSSRCRSPPDLSIGC